MANTRKESESGNAASISTRGGNNNAGCCSHQMRASLRQLKFAACGYLDTPNGVTEFKFLSASHDLASAMRTSELRVQAGQMRKVFKDFRVAKTEKKQRIVESVARTLLNMTSRRLSEWTIAAKTNPIEKGFGYALYEIGTDGRLVDISDVNLNGVIDRARIKVKFEGTADHDKWNDLDEEGLSAKLDDTFAGILNLLEEATRTSSSSSNSEESFPAESE